MIETLQTVDDALHRACVLSSNDDEIVRAAAAMPHDHVVLCVDVRDELGADLGARMLMAVGEMSGEEFEGSLRDAEAGVAKFMMEHATRVPLLTTSVLREWMDDELRGRGLHAEATQLASSPSTMVVVVAAGGVLLAPLLLAHLHGLDAVPHDV